MDAARFDNLIKGLCTKRLSRLSALRGLAAGAAAAVSGIALMPDQTEAKKKKHKQICHCENSDPASCKSIKPRKKSAKKHLKHSCDYAGPCVSGKSGCPNSNSGGGGPQPVVCNSTTCPDGFCVDDNCVECRDTADCCPVDSLDCDFVCVNGSCVPEVGCEVDTDCPANEICENNICVDEECGNDSHCPEGKICVTIDGDHGRCVFKDGCKIDTDCHNDQICEDDICVPQQCEDDADCAGPDEVCVEINNSHGRCEVTTCKVDTDCPNNKICVDDVCVPQECETNQDCPKGEICVETNNSHGRCEPVEGCKQDTDCAADEICEDHVCVPQECETNQDCAKDEICVEIDNAHGRCELEGGCKEDTECAANEICEDHHCVPQQCETDKDCAKDEICVEVDNAHGRCELDDECRYDKDCPEGQKCEKGECTNICSGKEPKFCPGRDENDRDACCEEDETCGYEPDGDAKCVGQCEHDWQCPEGQKCDKGECTNICSGKEPKFCPGKDQQDRDKCCEDDEVCGYEEDGDAKCLSVSDVCQESKSCQGNTIRCKRPGSNHYNQCVACPACLNS